MHVVYAG